MRVEEWFGLVTNASPFAVPDGAATELINMRAKSGRMVTRGGMRRITAAGGGLTQTLLDCYAVEIGGQPVLIAMNDAGELIDLRSPMHVDSPLVPVLPMSVGDNEVATDYAQNLASKDADYSGGDTLPGELPPTPASGTFVVDGGSASDDAFLYAVDGNADCPSLTEVDGGNAGFTGDTIVTVEWLCGSGEAGPPPSGDVPSAPLSLAATFGSASASLSWAVPSSDGGQPITGYEVQIATATSDFGTQPSAPGPVTATFGDTTASLSWAAPSSTGGFALTAYEVVVEASTNNGTTWTTVSI